MRSIPIRNLTEYPPREENEGTREKTSSGVCVQPLHGRGWSERSNDFIWSRSDQLHEVVEESFLPCVQHGSAECIQVVPGQHSWGTPPSAQGIQEQAGDPACCWIRCTEGSSWSPTFLPTPAPYRTSLSDKTARRWGEEEPGPCVCCMWSCWEGTACCRAKTQTLWSRDHMAVWELQGFTLRLAMLQVLPL